MQPSSLHFTLDHMNYVLVTTWEAFKLPSAKITHNAFNKTHTPPPPTHQTLTPTTKIVSLVLKNQT